MLEVPKKDSESSKNVNQTKTQEIKVKKTSTTRKKTKHKDENKIYEALNFIRGKAEQEEQILIEINDRKRYCVTSRLTKNKARETLKMAENAWLHYKRKFWRSYGLFIGLNLSIVIISSLMIILNLYAIRWNTSSVKEIIYYFIAIATGSLIITLLTSIGSFFSFFSKHEIYVTNINFLKTKLEQYKSEEVPDLHAFVNEIGKVDTDF